MTDQEQKKDEQKKTEDQAAAAPAAQPPEADADTKLKACETQRDEYLNNWKRAAADFINYKKEEMRRFSDMAMFATVDFAKDLLPVLDSFELGMHTTNKDTPEYKGMLMIRGQLQDVLRKKGIERIVVARGDVFNPEFHEAMMEVELPPASAGKPDDPEREKLSGKILEELVAGYKMGERVLRATKVKLGK